MPDRLPEGLGWTVHEQGRCFWRLLGDKGVPSIVIETVRRLEYKVLC